ncbi:topoisomerase C-terminal repeat-containing protein [Sporosarcina thermotolerans]|nr:type IA DNA topoisomerase [Sporosarcina thermotolerans]WHT49837.1 topoisomerase C-terminal repeat-containing protein [Sporosarcina thermotolerans]
MTAKWETYLRKIGNGEGSGPHFLDSISKFITKLLDDVPKQLEAKPIDASRVPPRQSKSRGSYQAVEVAPCPTCKTGTIVARKEFYGCSNYKNGCKQTFPGIFLKKKLTPTQVKLLCTSGKTNTIKGFTANNGNKFDACLSLEDGKINLVFT